MKVHMPALVDSTRLRVAVGYRADEPFAVTLTFPTEPEARWVLGRELLDLALNTGTAGLGDARLTARGDLLVLALSTPDGEGTAIFRRDDLATFLSLTYRMVPAGTEEIDWSAAAKVFPEVTF
ncbi:SsgA family sporulation/cell division regulator [Amycolatopsis roodepoortensis]|uniref:SsgA family sporulation/cell division regulator n=1 Tax=Amycolatopsis roodepoortensis TaxID=700274 RepID=UPI00214B016A|nr:SsgA family sporulation/cell division regulator [Amycolatopsis roodepoortensis]UUV34308.1 SsgA family sporulation/cell division regulator [Amycolatopsis roodepoortensis]